METNTNRSIELAGERIVSFTDRGQPVAFIFRKITLEDWKAFFAALIFESESSAEGRVTRADTKTAGLALVDSCLEHVRGYKNSDGADVEQLTNWKQRLPYGHRVKAAELLQDAGVSPVLSEDSAFVIAVGEDRVVLRAKWGCEAPGTMTEFQGLSHSFAQPSAEHQRRYNRAMSETRIVASANGSRTIHPSRHPLMMELYDELVRSVDGYQVSGIALGENLPLIRSMMDGMHKVMAVQQLFAPAIG